MDRIKIGLALNVKKTKNISIFYILINKVANILR